MDPIAKLEQLMDDLINCAAQDVHEGLSEESMATEEAKAEVRKLVKQLLDEPTEANLARFIKEHPYAGKGMGDEPHSQWIRIHEIADNILSQPVRKTPPSVLQAWVCGLSFMQQSVLVAAIRGPDGASRNHPSKRLVKWLRRCILYSAFESAEAGRPVALTSPEGGGGGSFTGPSCERQVTSQFASDHEAVIIKELPWEEAMVPVVKDYIDSRDELPAHYQGHVMHAVEIIGYKHPDTRIRAWWHSVYLKLAKALHLNPETEAQMDFRLGDRKDQWKSVQVETYQGRE